jgi:nucleoside 2-deoxyribosyltransferase
MMNILTVMPYKESWSQRVWDTLDRINAEDPSKQINIYRVDMTKIREEDLDKQIESINREAHVILADLTGGNKNVHIEIGFALALRKPLLLITQDRQDVPSHLRGKIIEEYDAGSDESLNKLRIAMRSRIKDKLEVVEAQDLNRLMEPKFNVECYYKREEVKLQEYFREAKDRIDILTTNLSFLFKEYSDDSHCYFDDIEYALKKYPKTMVRILTLDPESDFASKRGKQLGYAPPVFRDQLRDALKKTREVAGKYESGRFEVRTYDDFPNQITYRIDDHILNCVVAQPTQSRNHLTFKLNRKQAGVENSFIAHFQSIWGDAIKSP